MLVNTLRRFGLSESNEVSAKLWQRFTKRMRCASPKHLNSQGRSDITANNVFTPHSFVLKVTYYMSVTFRRLLKCNAV